MCCGIIYKGCYGEVIIDPHLYKPCFQKKLQRQPEEELEEEVEEVEEPADREKVTSPWQQSSPPGSHGVKEQEGEEMEKVEQGGEEW